MVVHIPLAKRDEHPQFPAAKAGNVPAALSLAMELLDQACIAQLRHLVGAGGAILLPVTALEDFGFNAIPDAMADILSEALDWPRSMGEIVQINRVGHTRARAFNRLVTPAAFEGKVQKGADYVLVDDHVGLGGTLANLKGYVESAGGRVVAMTTLTESREARHIALKPVTLAMLWERHGEALDELWKGQLGHGLNCLTDVEGRVLGREQTVDGIQIESLRHQSKFVNAASTLAQPKKGTNPRRSDYHVPKDQLFVERRTQGDYTVRKVGAERASAVLPTQAEAIARAKELIPFFRPWSNGCETLARGAEKVAKGLNTGRETSVKS